MEKIYRQPHRYMKDKRNEKKNHSSYRKGNKGKWMEEEE